MGSHRATSGDMTDAQKNWTRMDSGDKLVLILLAVQNVGNEIALLMTSI
jgi:hypothetical protein